MLRSNTPNSVIVRVTEVLSTVPAPMLLPPEVVGPNFKLTWTAISKATYRLEFRPGLALTNWDAVPGDVTALTNTACKLEPLTSSNRFYRIRSLP
jgi:hypothetical protein